MSYTVTNLITEVTDDTGRVDKAALIARYVKAAIIKCHEIDFFPRDLVTAIMPVSPAATQFSIALPALWRKFESIVLCTSAGVGLGTVYTEDQTDYSAAIEADDLTDTDLNYYKVKGDNVVFQSFTSASYIRWTYFAHPDVDTLSTHSWLMDKYPQAIIDLATGYIEKKIGNKDKAALNLEIFKNDWIPQIRQHLHSSL